MKVVIVGGVAGGATAADILALIAEVQDAVRARFGVRLETEVRVLGEG